MRSGGKFSGVLIATIGFTENCNGDEVNKRKSGRGKDLTSVVLTSTL